MKKLKIITIFLISIIVLTSCSSSEDFDIKGSIVPPKLEKVALEGTWELEKDDEEKNMDPTNIYIAADLYEFENKYSLNPKFESKYLNAKNYFNFNYPELDYTNITNEEFVEIIVISDGKGQLYQEIVKISPSRIFLSSEGEQYFFKKKSEVVPKEIYDKYSDKLIDRNIEAYNGKVSLLFTVKVQEEDEEGRIKTEYETYHLYYDNVNKNEYTMKGYKSDNIFISMKDNFGFLKYLEEWNGDKYTGKLIKSEIFDKKENKKNIVDKEIYSSEVPFELTFVSDEYYSLISSDSMTSNKKYYRMRLVDSEIDSPYVNIVDIAGKDGVKVIEESMNKEKETIDPKLNYPLDDYINIGLVRTNGSWQMKTSLVLGKEPNLKYKDININVIPKKEFVKNNSIDIKWSEIREKNKEVIDVVTSPEKNFNIVLETDSLKLYSITSEDPIYEIPLDGKTRTMIKSDWIVGNNADIWRENFIKLGGKEISLDN